MGQIIYSEKSRVFRGVFSVILIAISIGLIVGGIYLFLSKPEVTWAKTDAWELVLLFLLAMFLVYLALFLKMTVTVTEDSIVVKYLVKKVYLLKDVESCSTQTSEETFRQFLGYGIRFNRNSKGYVSNGVGSVRLSFKNRRDIVISSEDPDAFKAAVDLLI